MRMTWRVLIATMTVVAVAGTSACTSGAGVRQDPAPTVRAGCVLCLARMNCQNEAVTKALQALRTDADPRVREAVDQANARFGH